jgi:hypothetical protein
LWLAKYMVCRREDGRRRRPPAGPALRWVEKSLTGPVASAV